MSSTSARRLLVLGFDAMDVELVRRWAAAGRLPAFRRLFDTAAWCEYTHPPEYSSGMVWPSINTGLAPEQHDFFNVVRFAEDEYRMRERRVNELRGDPFWKWFAREGRRIVIADVPFSVPEPEYGGRQFWGWCQHDGNGEAASVPSDLLRRLSRQFGRHPVPSCFTYPNDARSLARFREGLVRGVRKRADLLCSLVGERDWDLFYAGFCESHCAGHLAWHLTDSDHPAHTRRDRELAGDVVHYAYVALDAALERVLGTAGPNTEVAVFFSHGMGPNHHGDHLFGELLDRFNGRRSGEPRASELAPAPPRRPLERLWQNTVGRVPASWRDRVKRRIPLSVRMRISMKRAQNSGAWARSPSFALPMMDGFSAVRVNLAGREPDGRIGRGAEYCDHLDELESTLLGLTNAETGGRAVDRIMRADRIVDPAFIGSGADLIVWWSKSAPLRILHSPELGSISAPWTDDRSGEHVMRGMFLLSHPHASAGQHHIDGMRATDIAPTLCELAGVAAPDAVFSGRSRLSELSTALEAAR